MLDIVKQNNNYNNNKITFYTLRCRRNLSYEDVLEALAKKGISIRVASPKLVMEEVCPMCNNTQFILSSLQAPESYKNVTEVVNTCKYNRLRT